MATRRISESEYLAVVSRAESGVSHPACEAMIPGACTGSMQEWHHRKLRSQGGGHEVVNGLGVCAGCHRAIHADPSRAYEHGWLVRGYHEPADMPVFRRGEWVFLTMEGGVEHGSDSENGEDRG